MKAASAVIEQFTMAAQEWLSRKRAQGDVEARRAFERDNPAPAPEAAVRELWDLVAAAPRDEASGLALAWIAEKGSEADAARALDAIEREHMQSPHLATLADVLSEVDTPQTRSMLEQWSTSNPSREVRGLALFALSMLEGGRLDRLSREGTEGDASAIEAGLVARLERMRDEYPDVRSWRGPLGEYAAGQLRELRDLVVGKLAPEIAGEEVHGQPMKLSDYRGKVVLLSFWGHW